MKVKELKLCNNCLHRSQAAKDCKWSGCKMCGDKHNTILGFNFPSEMTSCTLATAQNAIFSTAMVEIRDSKGRWVKARALLDCGSQCSFLTVQLCVILNLPKLKTNLTIIGINQGWPRGRPRSTGRL